ncbi:WD40-repeat-containing domain protein [Blastocladiella britannica]|nr:WD40-repeat-containing domain protein [Blastocladiella britannica]
MEESIANPTATTLATFDTEYSADAVEACPAHPHLFAVGTYQLLPSNTAVVDDDQGSQKKAIARTGRIYLHHLPEESATGGSDIDYINDASLRPIQALDCPAVLDMKWGGLESTTLAVGNSIGQVQLYSLNNTNDGAAPSLSFLSEAQVATDLTTLCLSLDWSNRRHTPTHYPDTATEELSPSIAVSLSSGELAVVAATPTGLVPTATWAAHTLEAWSVCYDPFSSGSTLYSGADDAAFCSWDVRVDPSATGPTSRNTRAHGAGVCAVACSPYDEWTVCTGSYDDSLRIWDKRTLGPRAQPLHTLEMGGGVWRLKWGSGANRNRIAVAGMYAGFFVVDLVDNEGTPTVTREYTAHKSIAYGVDWVGHRGDTLATCSFYDHSLHVWSP